MVFNRVAKLVTRRSLNQWTLLSQCYDKPPSKVPLMIRKDDQKSTIRCGILQNRGYDVSSTFLGALLADVYASDQSWLNVLLNRKASGLEGPIKIQFGDCFDIQQFGTLTKMVAPSNFLRDHDVEFLEIADTSTPSEDGCHFYIDLGPKACTSYHKWPTVRLRDTTKSRGLPLFDEINSTLAMKAILGFIRDKNTVDSYLRDMEMSNFANFSRRLAAKIDDKKQVYMDLGSSILGNLESEDESLSKSGFLHPQKQEMLKEIEIWRRFAHGELQSQVIPLVREFLRTHLSVWKIYSYSSAKFNLRIKELVEEPLRDLQMSNRLYELRGRLRLSTLSTAPLISHQYLERKVTLVYKDVNKVINHNFFKLQLPLILCSTVGYISEQFSLFSMGSLASLGVVVGLQRVLSSWEVAAKKIQENIYEEVRTNIEQEDKRLVQEVNENFSKQETAQERKLGIIRDLSSKVVDSK